MNLKSAGTWITDHPTESIVIGLAGALAVLWMLGVFSKPAAKSADAGAANMAGAYYAAEAQQAVIGGQIQAATIGAAAATRQNADNANAAVAINSANAWAAMTINGQNADSATTINKSSNDAAVAMRSADDWTAQVLGGQATDAAKTASYYGYATTAVTSADALAASRAGYDSATALGLAGYHSAETAAYYGYMGGAVASNNQLLATYSNNDTAVRTNAANNDAYKYVTNLNDNANLLYTAMQQIIPAELARTGGYANLYLPDNTRLSVNTGAPGPSPAGLAAMGFTPEQIARMTAAA